MLVVQRKKSGLGYFLCRSDAKMHNSDNGSGRGGGQNMNTLHSTFAQWTVVNNFGIS